MKVAWISTRNRVCGIADYSKTLEPDVAEAVRADGGHCEYVSLDDASGRFLPAAKLVTRIEALAPDLIHFQHEYGLYGGKNPPLYSFPRISRALRQALPKTVQVATGHTVIAEDYRFPLEGRGWQVPLREAANRWLLPELRRIWGPATWGAMDAVVVHSALQSAIIARAGCKRVEVIPHFVPNARGRSGTDPAPGRKTILVFGFFTPEKGQDVVISALSRLPADVRLVLAGGTRRSADSAYLQECRAKIVRLGLEGRVEITGYVPRERVDVLYASADLVVAPFRETSGSGSLAQAMARGAALLASDLPLNREIAERERGSVALFRSGDSEDCARQIDRLLGEKAGLQSLREGALRYAKACDPVRIAVRHLELYRSLRS